MLDTDKSLQRSIWVVTYGILFVALLTALYFILPMILTCLLGIGIGILVTPLLNWLEARWRFPRGLGAFVVLVLFFLIATLMTYGVYLVAADQFTSLQEKAPAIIERLRQLAQSNLYKIPWISHQLETFDFTGTASRVATPLWSGVLSGFSTLTGIAFAALIGLYTAVGAEEYQKMILRPFPPRLRPRTSEILQQCASVLRQWFRAQLTSMIIIGLLTAIGLAIVGVDYWAVFGLLTATLCIIPYVGNLIVITIASLITLASDPSKFLWVLLVFSITQQVEGNLILPMVMKGQADLPEVPLLIFMLVLGAWLGLFGVFLAPPLFAVLKVLYTEIYLPRIESTKPDLVSPTS